MAYVFLAAVLTALVVLAVCVVIFGYPALIIGALIGVVLAFVALFALTADGLRAQKLG